MKASNMKNSISQANCIGVEDPVAFLRKFDPILYWSMALFFFVGLLGRAIYRSLLVIPALYFWLFAILLLTSQISPEEIIPGFLLLGTTLPETFIGCLFLSLIVDLMTGKANPKKRMKLWSEEHIHHLCHVR